MSDNDSFEIPDGPDGECDTSTDADTNTSTDEPAAASVPTEDVSAPKRSREGAP